MGFGPGRTDLIEAWSRRRIPQLRVVRPAGPEGGVATQGRRQPPVTMVTVGIDPHKSSLTAVAVDEVGRKLAQITVKNRDEGFLQLRRWCTRFDTLPRFAVEDGRGMARRLVSALLATGAQVVWVPTKLMAQARASARTRGKSD